MCWPAYLCLLISFLKLSNVESFPAGFHGDYKTIFTSLLIEDNLSFYRVIWKISLSPEATSSTLSWLTDNCTQVSNAFS